MCTSNREAVATVVANVKRYLRPNREVKTVGLIVEDGLGMCQCAECVKGDLDPKDAFKIYKGHKYADAENKSKAIRYARLVNHVAGEIRPEFPDVLVGHAAYVDTQWAPRGVTLEPNVVTWVAVFWRDAAQPLSMDSPAPVNRFFMNILKEWRAAHRGRLIAYEYYMGMDAQKSLPYPMSQMILRDWPNLKKLGLDGATIQSWSTNHNVYGLNNLAFARCGWQDEVNHEALMDGYLSGMFGGAAVEIKPVFERLQAAVRRVEKEGTAASPWLAHYNAASVSGGSFLPDAYTSVYLLEEVTPQLLDRAVARARAKAAAGREKRQVELFAGVIDYWKRAAEPLRLDLMARDAEKQGKRAEAAAMLNEAIRKIESLAAYVESQPKHGWISVTTPRKWRRLPPDMRKRAQALQQA